MEWLSRDSCGCTSWDSLPRIMTTTRGHVKNQNQLACTDPAQTICHIGPILFVVFLLPLFQVCGVSTFIWDRSASHIRLHYLLWLKFWTCSLPLLKLEPSSLPNFNPQDFYMSFSSGQNPIGIWGEHDTVFDPWMTAAKYECETWVYSGRGLEGMSQSCDGASKWMVRPTDKVRLFQINMSLIVHIVVLIIC